MNLKSLDRNQLIGLVVVAVLVLIMGGMAVGRSVAKRDLDPTVSGYGQDDSPRARALRAMTRELR